ncbi:MAG: MgtC/SapB family protein [Proteobacteria bacterium]|nr:MgtC/SapB family protein [Pseudomonadota bacterium]
MQVMFLDELFKLILSATLGGLIGLERQIQGQKAGFRTQLILCLGSALYTITSIKFYEYYGKVTDPSRISAQIVVGIGFLGAGAIIKYRNYVRGLTTAATIWVVSAIGVAVGLGEYFIATITTFIALFNLMLLKKIESLLPSDLYSNIIITTYIDREINIKEILKSSRLSLIEYRENYLIDEKKSEYIMTVKYKNRKELLDFINCLKTNNSVLRVYID